MDIQIADVAALQAAVTAAKPGDRLVLAAGTYAFPTGNRAFTASAKGTKEQPIVVVSATPLAAKLDLGTLEGIVVSGSHWHFEGLDIRGTCASDPACEHAFHVVGGGSDFVLRGNRIVDFNAQLKVNADGPSAIPHRGLVENNELYDTRGRKTDSPVTKLNIDTGDDWIVRENVIRDFFKDGGNGISYGVFLKSGGRRGILERNLVLCERDVKGGTRIGMSFGGGGTGAQFCAPAFDANTPCAVEHEDGVMRNNIIASCSDVGIYLNKAKNTKLLHNTLLETVGIDFRFAPLSGLAQGNLLTGRIKDRDGGVHTDTGNLVLTDPEAAALYQDGSKGDLRKKGDLTALLGKAPASPDVTDDYCERARGGGPYDVGALQHSLGDCVTTVPGGTGTGGSGGATGSGGTGGNPATAGSGGTATAGGSGGGSMGTAGGPSGAAGTVAGTAGKSGASTAGNAGASAGGGPLATGGKSGSSAGPGGAGRAGSSNGGASGAASTPAANASSDDGCSCRISADSPGRSRLPITALFLALALALGRRRA